MGLPPDTVKFPLSIEFTLSEYLALRRELEHGLCIVNRDRDDTVELWMKIIRAAGMNPVDPRVAWRLESERNKNITITRDTSSWWSSWWRRWNRS